MNKTVLARSLGAGSLMAVCMCLPPLQAQTLDFLHVFEGTDGSLPTTPLIQSTNGSFYGITTRGGNSDTGTAFQMAADGTVTTLVSFDGPNGSYPASLVQGADGNFYGATHSGGDLTLNGGSGYGTVFQMTPDGTLTTLVQFTDDAHAAPENLLLGRDGNFYGTTQGEPWTSPPVYGTFFEVKPGGVLTTLAQLDRATGPLGAFMQGSDGNFYGTTPADGTAIAPLYGLGRVFRMSPAGLVTTLVIFNATNSDDPLGWLVQGADGSFYGTTSGLQSTSGPPCGTVFKVASDGGLSTVVAFSGTNGCHPWAGLVQARDGNFYGTTASGGDFGYGTVFQMTPDGRLTTLASFDPSSGLFSSNSLFFSIDSLVQGSDGNLYGTTHFGGDLSLIGGRGAGTVFRLALPPPSPVLSLRLSANQVILSWPTNATGFTLQSSSDLTSTNWTDSAGAPSMVGNQYTVTNVLSAAAQFYRLKK